MIVSLLQDTFVLVHERLSYDLSPIGSSFSLSSIPLPVFLFMFVLRVSVIRMTNASLLVLV